MPAILAVASRLVILLALASIALRGIVPERRGVIAPLLGVAGADGVGFVLRGAGGGCAAGDGAGRGAWTFCQPRGIKALLAAVWSPAIRALL